MHTGPLGLPRGARAAACGLAGAVAASAARIAIAPDPLIPIHDGGHPFLTLFGVWLVCALVAASSAVIARCGERGRELFAAAAAITAASAVCAARWSAGPFDSAGDRLAAVRPSSVLTTDGLPVRVTEGLEVVLDCEVDYWCESVDRVRRARHGAERSAEGSIAIARLETHWIVARGDHDDVRWANGTAFDADSLQPVTLIATISCADAGTRSGGTSRRDRRA